MMRVGGGEPVDRLLSASPGKPATAARAVSTASGPSSITLTVASAEDVEALLREPVGELARGGRVAGAGADDDETFHGAALSVRVSQSAAQLLELLDAEGAGS